jgi:hypothetical protein
MPAALGREAAAALRLLTGGADPEDETPPMLRRPRVRRAELMPDSRV